MAEHTMATVLFISVFVFLFFKFCLGAPPLGPEGGAAILGAAVGAGTGVGDNLAADGGALPPLPLARKCPLGTMYSVAVGDCKDLVRSTKGITQRLQLLMPYLLAATQGRQPHH